MPVLPNMGLITPTLGGDSGTWDDKINACFALVDAHDHTSGKGVPIVTAAININADLPMGGYGLTALGKLSFTAITAPSTGSKNLFVNTSDNELYWRTAGGTNVKLTLGTSINTTLVGGIVGDYTSVGAEVAFDDANKRYTFKDQSSPSKKWARLASGPVRLYEYNTTVTNYVELASPSALAASYTVTWPAAVPGATSLMQMSAAGVLTASNTVPALTLAAGYKFTAFTRTTEVPLGATMFSAAVNIGSSAITGTSSGADGAIVWMVSTGTSWSFFTMSHATWGLRVGDRPKSVTVYGSYTGTVGWTLYRYSPAASTATLVQNIGIVGSSGTPDAIVTPVAIAAGERWIFLLQGAATGSKIYGIEVTYDRP